MITRAAITKRADLDGVDARVVERDYVLAHVVALVAAHDADGALVFKGGTSLRLLHYERYRYSADLDYSVVRGDEAAAIEAIRAALGAARPAAITALTIDGDPPRVHYVGPLGAGRTIKLDVTDDELVVHTERRPPIPRWPDVPAAPVLAYSRLEIAAEKLRCLIQRLQCRDLLDLDLLISDGVDVDDAAALFRRKAAHRKLDPASLAEKYAKRVADYEPRWETELGEYLTDVPHFAEVERSVRRALKRAGLL